MSNYLREVLGAEKTFLNPNQPQGLVADVGPDLPGGDGANEGFWRQQLRDRLGQFAKMFGTVLFDMEIEGIGRVTGHGELVEIVRPQVGLVRIKNHSVLPDMDIEIPGDNLEAIDALIPDKDYERVTGKDVTPNTEPTPELKDEVTGDEAMQVVRNAGAEYAKSQGRFPMARTYNDIKQGLRSQYSQLLEGIKQDTPELLKNQFILNEDGTGRFGDIETDGDFWGAIEAMKVNTGNRWVAPDGINPLAKEVNRRYAEKFLGLKKDGLISFYRNVIQEKDIPAEATAGYASLDKKMAWDYNSQMSGSTEVNRGRYIVKAKPDEVLGILGLSGAVDEFGVVISPEVTGLPGRSERVGNLEKQRIDTAPWVDYEELDKESRVGGNSPFRFLAPMANFDYYALDSSPFGEEGTWASFIKTNNLPDKSVSKKYDEIYGAGSWEKDWKGSNPTARVYADLFVKFTDKDGKEKWGLNAPNLRNLSTTDMLNFAEPGDDFDRGIKLLSTMQELLGKPFFVNKGHDQSDPRIPDEPTQINNPPAELDKKEFKGSKLLDSAIKNNEINYDALPESTLTASFDRKDIPKEQDEAISAYSGSEFLDINAYLRADEVSILTTKDYLDRNISNIDALIDEKGDVLEETKVYRGTNSMVDSGTHRMLDALQEGDIIEDPAYSSTTKNSKIAFSNFGLYSKIYDPDPRKVDAKTKNGGNSSFWSITLPVGSKALAKPEDQYPHSHEKEILLPRGSKYKINGIRKIAQIDENGNETGSFNYFIDATVQLESAEVVKDTPNTTNLKSEPSLDLSNFEKVSDRLGSNPGGVYKDPATGKQYYVKIQDKKRGDNEQLASALYKEAGLDALEVKSGTLNGDNITYTDWRDEKLESVSGKISGSDPLSPDDPAFDGFAIDAWLANWDVVGTGYDNLSFDKDGNPVRLDSGGSLLYRARGDRKGEAFGEEVGELETFKNTSNTTGQLFQDMGTAAEARSVKKLEAITPERIDELVDQFVSDPNDNKELKDKLKARREFILSKYDQEEPEPTEDNASEPENSIPNYRFRNDKTGWEYSDDHVVGSNRDNAPTDEELDAIVAYTGKGYDEINSILRGQGRSGDSPFSEEEIDASIENLTNLIDRNPPLGTNALVYRGVNNYGGFRWDSLEVGDEIVDKGFVSVSPNAPTAGGFGSVQLEIEVLEDTKAIDVSRTVEDTKVGVSEQELILQRGTKFKVVAKTEKKLRLQVIGVEDKAKDLFADPSAGEGAYTEEMVYRPKTANEPKIDTTGTRLSSDSREGLDSLISNFNLIDNEASSQAYRDVASELGRPISLPWDDERTPEGRETYEYIYSAKRFKKTIPENSEEAELIRIKNLFKENLDNNKNLQEAKKTLASNKLYKDLSDALNSEINDFDEDDISFALMDMGRNLSRPRPRINEDEVEDFSITTPDFNDDEINSQVYDVTVDVEESAEITNRDLKEFSESAAVSIILPSRALEEVLNEGRMKTVHETKYSLAGESSERYRALRVGYESLAFGYNGDSPMEERPVYGLLRSETLPMPEDALMIYGGRNPAQIILKPEAKSRTTISDRDSLNHFEPTTPLSDPKFEPSYITQMVAVYRKGTGENFFETENFAKYGSIEAQVHGGVKLEDIGKVLFYETPSEEIRELLTSKGIIWEVSRSKPYSKPRSFGGGMF